MNIIVCLDDKSGMMFNNRRQSRDRLLIRDLINRVGDKKLYVSKYSAELFEGTIAAVACDNPLEAAALGDYCFVEDVDIVPYKNKIEKVFVYRWNRRYPADRIFPFEITDTKEICEFAGSSHEKISLEEVVNYE